MKQLSIKNNKCKSVFKASLCIAFYAINSVGAQVNYSEFITSGEPASYYKNGVKERKFVPTPQWNEVDVKFSKRIVRCIDARQKMNKQLEWPRQPLNKLLYEQLCLGGINAYQSDSMASVYNSVLFRQRGGVEIIIQVFDNPDDPTDTHDSTIFIDYDYTKIHKYWVMEDWIFDYKHGVFKPVILAIAPIFAPAYAGITTREMPLCWIKMEEVRGLLSHTEMFNRYNDASRLSYDDFFQMRIFDSYIVFQSNVFDNYINQFPENDFNGVAALLASDGIKNDLFIFEHDLWQY